MIQRYGSRLKLGFRVSGCSERPGSFDVATSGRSGDINIFLGVSKGLIAKLPPPKNPKIRSLEAYSIKAPILNPHNTPYRNPYIPL